MEINLQLDLNCSFTIAAVWYILYTQFKRGGAGGEKVCESTASYSGSAVYVGEQRGLWRGMSLGGVCYQGTKPNSWLILELLERKSRGLTFPAVFLFLEKIVLEIHVCWEMQHVFNFVPPGMQLKVVFTGVTYRMFMPRRSPVNCRAKLFEVAFSNFDRSEYCIIVICRKYLYSNMTVTFCVFWSFLVLKCLWLHVINFFWRAAIYKSPEVTSSGGFLVLVDPETSGSVGCEASRAWVIRHLAGLPSLSPNLKCETGCSCRG